MTASFWRHRVATLMGFVGTCAVVVLWALVFADLRRAGRLDLDA